MLDIMSLKYYIMFFFFSPVLRNGTWQTIIWKQVTSSLYFFHVLPLYLILLFLCPPFSLFVWFFGSHFIYACCSFSSFSHLSITGSKCTVLSAHILHFLSFSVLLLLFFLCVCVSSFYFSYSFSFWISPSLHAVAMLHLPTRWQWET